MKHHWHYHEDTYRKTWQDADAVLAAIGLEPGSTFIEIGCGQGYFTLPAARIIGAKGTVYGIDLNEEAIELLKQTASSEGLDNMHLITGEAETAVACEHCADIVFLGNVLHDFYDPAKVLGNARLMIKPEGRLINVDWRKESADIGPRIEKRFSQEYAAELITNAGFNVESITGSGKYHYMITAKLV